MPLLKANPVIVVTPYDVTYDGDPHTATGTAKGVKAEIDRAQSVWHHAHQRRGLRERSVDVHRRDWKLQ